VSLTLLNPEENRWGDLNDCKDWRD
jgi:hypothetical protein